MRRSALIIALTSVALTTSSLSPPAAVARPRCFGKRATILGTAKNSERLVGTKGPDVIVGRGGFDYIEGRGGDDRLCGGGDTDYIVPGKGRDKVDGGTTVQPLGCSTDRNDQVSYRRGRAVAVSLLAGIATGQGRDVLVGIESVYGSNRDDTIQGDDLSNCLIGWDGNDIMFGRSDDDVLFGAKGDDTLIGDDGIDLASGEDGIDTCDAESEFGCEL